MPSATVPLPGPRERPDAHVVIFDGHCQFCQRQVRRLHALDRRGILAYVSLHDALAAELAPNLTHDQLMEQMYVVERDGTQHGGAAAFRFLTRHLPLLWPLAPVLHIPGSLRLWSWLYRQVAIRRYRWNKPDCEGGTCQVHFGKHSKA